MSKMKIYELAKELNKSSKELMEFLAEKNIEAKSHMSSLEDETVDMVKNALKKPEKEETPKKKKYCACIPSAEFKRWRKSGKPSWQQSSGTASRTAGGEATGKPPGSAGGRTSAGKPPGSAGK